MAGPSVNGTEGKWTNGRRSLDSAGKVERRGWRPFVSIKRLLIDLDSKEKHESSSPFGSPCQGFHFLHDSYLL